MESPSAKTFRFYHPPTEARYKASQARGPAEEIEAHLDESGFGGWVIEKSEVLRAAAPLQLTQPNKRMRPPKISSTTFDNSSHRFAGSLSQSCDWNRKPK